MFSGRSLVKSLRIIRWGFFLWSLLIIGGVLFYLGLYRLKYIEESIPISGTGSMYPTFPKGTNKSHRQQAKEIVSRPYMLPYPNGFMLFGQRYFGYVIKRGDIVEFENTKTREITKKLNNFETGMVKRAIAFPGETIEIKDATVYINGSPLNEPYIATGRSTFGAETIPECKKILIPKNKLVVLGDNRKISGDSRHELGLIDFSDIEHVIPLPQQKGVLDKYWRDTTHDLEENAKIRLNTQKYLALLNQKRIEAGVKTLDYEPKLEESAKKRAEAILKFNDFSFEATRSGLTMKQAMQRSGYSNIVWGEAPLQGYYEAEELIDNQFEFPSSKKFLLHKDYQDFALAAVEGEINGCPTQVIVQQFAGYLPPNYTKEDIDTWKKLLSRLQEIQPSWQKTKTYVDFYGKNKTDIDRINEVIATRIKNVEAIVKKMENNLWLNNEENQYIKNEEKLSHEQESLAEKLNK